MAHASADVWMFISTLLFTVVDSIVGVETSVRASCLRKSCMHHQTLVKVDNRLSRTPTIIRIMNMPNDLLL